MIAEWLKAHGLSAHTAALEGAAVDLDILPDLTEEDLQRLGLPLGDRKRLIRAAARLREASAPPAREAPEPAMGGGPAHGAERRQLTVMFCDLVGSTALATHLDPEDFSILLGRFHSTCRVAIEAFGGQVGQLLGDGVLSYFGYPTAHEGDVERAVNAALDVLARVAELTGPNAARLEVKIGIATGVVVVGDSLESGDPNDGMVLGEAPNLASRLQALADPGSVLISDGTHRLLGATFECDDLGLHDLRGVPQPARVWRVVRRREGLSRFEATRSPQLSRVVGRDAELQRLLELWHQASAGAGKVALVCGEAGIGKSRVSLALFEAIGAEPHTLLRYQCSPFHVNTPFHAVITQLTAVAGMVEGDTGEARRGKLETLLAETGATPEDTALFAALLSIPADGRNSLAELTPQRRKERTIAALVAQLVAQSRVRPVLVLFEDLHWVDASTLEALGRAIEAIRGSRIMILATFRPEFFPPWLEQSHVTMVRLNRLAREDTARLLAGITGGKPLPAQLADLIQAKTDGVPLFVEELTKSVLESGLLEEAADRFVTLAPLKSLAIPATLHDSLAARLDRLATVRDIAQIGAVLGREFPYRLIAAVAETPEQRLRAGLAQLTAAELIFSRGEPPDSHYSFKHALVQDAAYDSLLRSRRQVLHARVAEVLTRDFQDLTETQPELIAHHLARSGQVEPAIDQMLLAGRRAIERSANAEAIGQLLQALDLLEGLPEGPSRAAKALALEVTLGQAMIANLGYAAQATKDVLQRARTHINASTAPDQKFAVLYGLWACYYVGSDVAMQREAASEFLAETELHGDPAYIAIAHRAMGTTLVTMGEFSIARMHLRKAAELFDPVRDAGLRYRFGQDPGAAALAYLSWTLWHTGQLNEALRVAQEAVDRAEAVAHPHSVVYTVAHARGMVDMFRHAPEQARDYAAMVTSVSEEHGFPFWGAGGRILLGWALVNLGNEDEGIELLRAGIAAWRKTGAKLWLTLFLAHEADAHARAGRAGAARQTIEEALALAEETGEIWALPELLRIKASIIRRLDGRTAEREIEALLRQSLAAARGKQARWWELCSACDLARLWAEQGRLPEARELVAAALSRFPRAAGEAHPDLLPAEALLRDLDGMGSGPGGQTGKEG
ncbi:MAG: AAA family ATPase [Acetobacteraceae bacterium]|nr:AAA family ATPase [Acetobacteraceae bacterium]